MIRTIKRGLFKALSLENYLRLLQRSYFILYKTGVLRTSHVYTYHYFVKKLVNKGDTVIDIGANLGYYSLLFAKWVGPSGKVYAVEPVPVYNKIFSEKAGKYDNITLYPYALGTEEKAIDMVSSTGKGYLSTGLLHVHDVQNDGSVEDEEFRFRAEMTTPSKLFGKMDKINYIKCDTEGFEYNVFSDMKDIIQRHIPRIQVEIAGPNKEKLNGLLAPMGYTLCKLVNDRLAPEENISDQQGGEYLFIHKDDPAYPETARRNAASFNGSEPVMPGV